ncbi:thioesterase II family protein [Rickettsia endosymbiont of Cardiosporidium cionae]|uniref:thioesterase II family protein n=1 Tax=Rickettsia endosymbiont of Cardiosporidium cionae TaxID=2777155 RepID=UPI00189515E1|nr:thioesterase domain-containing protein [Rickettsia endosymbiont of Cardiosporidium cionae]KAF8818623.1 thioesterase [Rickettsia endosymbiont of Cardiosporidium cionae]
MISYNTTQNYDHILVFFPFAVGSGELYIPWFKYFSSNICCRYAELKGRGRHFHENAFDTIEELIDDFFPKLYTILDKAFSFFGHSMGALIAFEPGKSLYKKFNIVPCHLFA